jgi:hypothetical protein
MRAATPSESHPFATVVVTAFDRPGFVAEALRSALQQSIPRTEFEVLLVTNLPSEGLDTEWNSEGVQILRPPRTEMGSWIADAADLSRGEVLALLDDDDVFFTDKLGSAARMFRARPRLGYLRHTLRPFRDTAELPEGSMSGDRTVPPHPAVLSVPANPSARQVARAWWAGGAANPSSLVVRRDLVAGLGDHLRSIEIAVGPMLFYAAVLNGGEMAIDPTELGGRRLHVGNMSGVGHARPGPRWARQLDVSSRALRDAERVRGLLRERNAAPALAAPLDAMVARVELLRSSASSHSTRGEVARGMLRVLRTNRWRRLPGAAPVLRVAFLRFVRGRPYRAEPIPNGPA